jgi:predicted GNAT superfamily acetyltransferase
MHVPISIRPAHEPDYPAILALNNDADPRVLQLTRETLLTLVAQATFTWVAMQDQTVAGYLIGLACTARYDGEEFAWFRTRGEGFLYVDQVVVGVDFRGKGIGTALYSSLEAWARRHGWTSIACEVHLAPPNPESYAFHRRRGFAELERLDTSDGRRVALLHKELAGS